RRPPEDFPPPSGPRSGVLTERRLYPSGPLDAPVPPSLPGHEVDHQGHPLEPVRISQPVLEIERPVPRDQLPVVHLDREPGRPPPNLRRVREAKPPAVTLRRRPLGDDARDEAVQLRGGDPLRGAVGERDRLAEHGADSTPRNG